MRTAIAADLETLDGTTVAPFVPRLASLHRALCPRQVLGVRMALLAADKLGVPFPQGDKRAIILPEIDGCFADGLMVVSGCSVGHRTMRVVHVGKIAATFVDTQTEHALRVWPRVGVRIAACTYASRAESRWHAQRLGYARMPDAELLDAAFVRMPDVARQQLQFDIRTTCARCGEEVFNNRHVVVDGADVCRPCVQGRGPNA